MEKLISLINQSKYIVVFTGAGVSTLSGIRDFRGKNGIYKDYDAEKIFDIDYFLRDPYYYYRYSKNFIYNLHTKNPNIIHRECARLEEQGQVKAVITQNIDLLHQKAGSRHVIEVHGSPMIHRCLRCGKKYEFEWISRIVNDDRIPHCESCRGVIKPDITFFGERLPDKALSLAVQEAGRADLMLVLGSSLVVQPAASIPLYTLENGGKMIIINDGQTPLDGAADLRYDDLEPCFQAIAEKIP
ncbi:MAG: NAD-dependent protein deacylase [Candidatus Omnitrophica bacterium]|nr:NAD-dependent protein deacylase [Candidatus Omnitrophota bacterium]